MLPTVRLLLGMRVSLSACLDVSQGGGGGKGTCPSQGYHRVTSMFARTHLYT